MSDVNNNNGLAMTGGVGVAKHVTDEAFKQLAKSVDYLPRFQLYGFESKEVKRGVIPGGHYGLVAAKDDITDLGVEAQCYVLGLRLKALRIIGDKVENFFDPNHDEFKAIKAASGDPKSGCMAGPEYLLYLPGMKQFCTFFMANKTARREAPKVRAFLPTEADPVAKAATLKIQFIETSEYAWHGPVIVGCSIPLAAPDMDTMNSEIAKFNNPPEPKEVAASVADAAATQRAR